MTDLTRRQARQIIEQLGSSGQPPEFGVNHFSVGLDPYLDVILEEYIGDFIQDGGSAFKLVVGIYGGGKTHFLYSVRDIAWAETFAVSYVSLKSGGESPFDKLHLVYKSIINGLIPPVDDENTQIASTKGIENFLRYWYRRRLENYRNRGISMDDVAEAIREDIDNVAAADIFSISFRNAIVEALKAIQGNDENAFSEIAQWLKGELTSTTRELKGLGITQKINRESAFGMIRSLAQVVRALEYNGLVILLDEAEQIPSMGRRAKDQLLNNLREFIDECGTSNFAGIMVFYAVPDRGFLDGKTQVYEALRQRLATVFNQFNPTGVVVELEDAVNDEPIVFLTEVGSKVINVYNVAFKQKLNADELNPWLTELADSVHQERFGDEGYKRLFVRRLVSGLNIIHRKGEMPTPDELRDGQ